VKGSITPAACTLSFVGNNSEVSFGATYASALSATSYKDLGTRDITLEVNCDAQVVAVMRVTDNRSSSAIADAASTLNVVAATKVFGLGTVKNASGDDVSIGSYNVTLKTSPVVDGTTLSTALTSTDKQTWKVATAPTYLSANGQEYYAGGNSSLAPISGKITLFPMTLHAVANKSGVLPTQNEVTLDGAAQFEVSYL
jgi:hypothetical protein